MSSPCQHDCQEDWKFPQRPNNRPGLERICYRIGTYADFRDYLLRNLSLDPVLSSWTHRGSDDPGIALLEGAAILGDILAFYQDLYANEAFLRTAQWRESVAELVRLLGYRLSPGLGGQGAFAFEVTGQQPVNVPKAFPIQAQLETGDSPAEFETVKELNAYPELGQFHLYRPFQLNETMTSNSQEFYFVPQGASTASLELEEGDRVFLGNQLTIGYISVLLPTEIAVVDSVREWQGMRLVSFKGHLQKLVLSLPVVAYKIGRTFNHFGHQAPSQVLQVNTDSTVTPHTINYDRYLDIPTTGVLADGYDFIQPDILADELILDQEVNDLALGSVLLCQGIYWKMVGGVVELPLAFTMIRQVGDVSKGSYTWGSISASASIVKMANNYLWTDLQTVVNRFDVRTMQMHEAISPAFILKPVPGFEPGPASRLYFFGSADAAQALSGRTIILQDENAPAQEYVVSKVEGPQSDIETRTAAWNLILNQPVDYASFPHIEPIFLVYGNVTLDATQGKTEKEKCLGHGDNRQVFQTFKLPKAPLTYLRHTSQTPPEVPELEIYVDNRKWTWVPSLFGHGPKEEIYVVRENEQGESHVQFGDGKTGARLPSGQNNVRVRYRTGVAAQGYLKEGASAQPGQRLDRLKKVYLPGQVIGGAEPEGKDQAKTAAPGKVQSLDRLVSLADYETEALTLAGVRKVKAQWGLPQGSSTPAVLLTVLMASGQDDGSQAEIEKIMNEYNRERGPERFSVVVEPGIMKYITVGLEVGYDSRYRQEDMMAAIKIALGVCPPLTEMSKGLMSIEQRDFGELEYRTRIQGQVQNVPGVLWVQVTSLAEMGENCDPATLVIETNAGPDKQKIDCGPQQLLALYNNHLQLSLIQESGA